MSETLNNTPEIVKIHKKRTQKHLISLIYIHLSKQKQKIPNDSLKPMLMQKRLVILVLGTFFSFSAADQSEKVFITDKVSDTYAYVDVMKTYERIAAKGYKSVDLFQKLGDPSYWHFKLEKLPNGTVNFFC